MTKVNGIIRSLREAAGQGDSVVKISAETLDAAANMLETACAVLREEMDCETCAHAIKDDDPRLKAYCYACGLDCRSCGCAACACKTCVCGSAWDLKMN